MREIFITDLYSNHTKAVNLLSSVNFDIDNDKLILGGDYFSDGPESVEVAQWLSEIYKHPNVYLLRGSFDTALIDLLSGRYKSSSFAFNNLSQTVTAYGMRQVLRDLAGGEKDSYREYAEAINYRFPKLLSALRSTEWYFEFEDSIYTHAVLPDDYTSTSKMRWETYVWLDCYEWAGANSSPSDKLIHCGHIPLTDLPCWGGTDPMRVGGYLLCNGAMNIKDGIVNVRDN